MSNKGFLLVLMQPPPSLEDEFNAWYDTEHLPERLAVPGFETALRFVCLDGHPRYLAMYDLERPEVLDTPEYLKVSFERSSPWTKRVTSRVKVYRSAGRQIHPGNLITGRCARVLVMRFSGLATNAERELVAGLRTSFEGNPDVIQSRLLAYDTGKGIDYLAFVEAKSGVEPDLKAFGAHSAALDLVNTYAPY